MQIIFRQDVSVFCFLELPVIVGLSNSDAFPELLGQQPDLKPYVDWAISVMRSEQPNWVDKPCFMVFASGCKSMRQKQEINNKTIFLGDTDGTY